MMHYMSNKYVHASNLCICYANVLPRLPHCYLIMSEIWDIQSHHLTSLDYPSSPWTPTQPPPRPSYSPREYDIPSPSQVYVSARNH